jgi:hypothetical protein
MEQRHHRRQNFKVYCDKAGKKIWLREVIVALGRLHAVKFPLRETCKTIEKKNI